MKEETEKYLNFMELWVQLFKKCDSWLKITHMAKTKKIVWSAL